MCSYHSISAFSDLIAVPRWPQELLHSERWSLLVSDWQAGIHRGTGLEWLQCLFTHYFDSELLQIEDSAARGLGNFLASHNVLSLNWFFRDNYLRPSNCSRKQAEGVRWHIFIFKHVLGLLSSLTWIHNYRKGKAAPKEKLLLRPKRGSPVQIFYVKTYTKPLCALSYVILLNSHTDLLRWVLLFPFPNWRNWGS